MHMVYIFWYQNKWYVGVTNNRTKRVSVHLSRLRNPNHTELLYEQMRKDGPENYRMDILAVFKNRKDALAFEKNVIQTRKGICLNIQNNLNRKANK